MVSIEKIRIDALQDLDVVADTTADMYLLVDVGFTVAGATLPFPATPVDGQIFGVSTRSQVISVTLSSGTIPISGPITTMLAGSFASWVYDAVSNRWFRYT